MQLKIKSDSLPARLREWLDSSISNRFTFAALSLTMVVALVIGISSYGVVTLLVSRSVKAELNSQATLTLQKLQADLNGLANDLASMAGNSFIANGLVEFAGQRHLSDPLPARTPGIHLPKDHHRALRL